MEITAEQKEQLRTIGERHGLRFIILHGSHAKGTSRQGSDLDIAILGKRYITFDELLAIHGGLGNVFGDNEERELDTKSLHKADLLLRYYITCDGILLYGEDTDFNEYKAYARRVFEDAKGLFRLEEKIIKKQNKLILETLHA